MTMIFDDEEELVSGKSHIQWYMAYGSLSPNEGINNQSLSKNILCKYNSMC